MIILSMVNDKGNGVDVDIDLESLDFSNPDDVKSLVDAVRVALQELDEE